MLNFLKNIFSKKTKPTKFPNIVIGQIIALSNHPNADRLHVATVNVGHHLKIVCGASNIAIGQLVPVALIGAKLADGKVIQQASIRGVNSEGMLCSGDELSLNHDNSGIIILSKGKIGNPIDDAINSPESNQEK
jgi:phenylalanyl-tRNA synthetase beta chain